MAIKDVWTFTVKVEKSNEARQWLFKTSEYHKSQGINALILNPMNGSTATIVSSIEYESLQAMQDYNSKFFQSDAWKEFDKEPWHEWFVDAATVRHQYHTMD